MLIKQRAVSLITLVCALALVSACGDKQPEQANRGKQSFRVVVEPVNFVAETTRVEAVGTSRALRSITVYPATSGEVVAVHFKPGQYVEQNTVLVDLDQRDEQLAVQLAEVRLAEAERLYQRYQRTVASGATLPTELDAAKAQVDAARIELDRARIDLDDRIISAPFSGHVGITDVEVGDRVQTTTPITTLDDRSALMVTFAVPEMMVGKLQVGDAVAISTWNASSADAFGEVVEIDSRISPETRTFITRARVDNADDGLRPGMSFRVALDLRGDDHPVLPEIALQWGADGSFVWSVVEGKAQRVPVSIVQRQEGKVLVKSNLQAGDLVVVEGIQRLRPGISVQHQSIEVAEEPAESSSNSVDGRAGPG